MKKMILVSMMLASTAFADTMPKEKLSLLADEAAEFKSSCLDSAHVSEVKALNISNKTAEAFSKDDLAKLLQDSLKLKVNPTSHNVLNVKVESSSHSQDGITTIKYQVKLELAGNAKATCKNSYTIESKETK